MNAVKTYKKPWLRRRNDQIAKLFLDGVLQRTIAKKYGISISNVSQIIHRMGGKITIEQRFDPAVAPSRPSAPLLNLDEAYDKLARIYQKMAFEVADDLAEKGTTEEKMRYLRAVAPMIRNRAKQLRPRQTRFHLHGVTIESLEQQLLDYALGEKNQQ